MINAVRHKIMFYNIENNNSSAKPCLLRFKGYNLTILPISLTEYVQVHPDRILNLEGCCGVRRLFYLMLKLSFVILLN